MEDNYIGDSTLGINQQAKAILDYLATCAPEFAEHDNKFNIYKVNFYTHAWYNGRETGFVISMHRFDKINFKNMHIAVFEHRNSDNICAVKWISDKMHLNNPTIEDVPVECYPDKWSVSYEVGYGQVSKMVDWIYETLENHYIEQSSQTVNKENKNE